MCIYTHTPIQAYCQAWHALTSEGALCVHTASIHAHARSFTLINVKAEASSGVQVEARLADALEAAFLIHAHTILANIPQALVLVLAVLSIRCEFKASIAHTVETAHRVDTASIVANAPIGHTLIQIYALCPGGCGLKARSTLAEVRASCVHTFAVHTWTPLTLVIVNALSTRVQFVAHVAFTAVALRCRDTATIDTEIDKVLAHVGDVLSQWFKVRAARVNLSWVNWNLRDGDGVGTNDRTTGHNWTTWQNRPMRTSRYYTRNTRDTRDANHWDLGAQPQVLICSPHWAHLWGGGAGPAASAVTAALVLRHGLRVGIGTSAINHAGVAEACPGIYAARAVYCCVVALRASAEVASNCVGTLTTTA